MEFAYRLGRYPALCVGIGSPLNYNGTFTTYSPHASGFSHAGLPRVCRSGYFSLLISVFFKISAFISELAIYRSRGMHLKYHMDMFAS